MARHAVGEQVRPQPRVPKQRQLRWWLVRRRHATTATGRRPVGGLGPRGLAVGDDSGRRRGRAGRAHAHGGTKKKVGQNPRRRRGMIEQHRNERHLVGCGARARSLV
jgi:hypothetical protein